MREATSGREDLNLRTVRALREDYAPLVIVILKYVWTCLNVVNIVVRRGLFTKAR